VGFLKPTTSKTPDLCVSREGIRTAIECKYLHAEQWENWVDDLNLEWIRLSSQQKLTVPSYEIIFEPRLPDIVGPDEAVRKAIQREITERLFGAVKEVFQTDPPQAVQVQGIAWVCPRPELPNSQIRVGGIQVSPQAKTRRIIQNAVLEAAVQLRESGPGAVVIHAHFTPAETLLDVALRAFNRADPFKLSAVAVVAVTASLGSPAVVWQNPLVPGKCCDGLTETFQSALRSRGPVRARQRE
jgi:hypothetical protein